MPSKLARAAAPGACLLVLLLLVSAPAGSQAPPPFDLLVTGGRVLDGTGNPWFAADVGVRGGRLEAVGDLGGATAARTIDAAGLYVAPGFIDLHSHSDRGLGLPELRHNPNMVAQGVTLSVVNQDGRSPTWPLRGQRALYERQGIGNNVALLVGHGTVRSRAMGARQNGPATEADIRAMQALVEEGMKDGAFGLSAGLEYVPGRFSDTRELVELARIVRPWGGVFISHQRSEGRDPMWRNASDPERPIDLLEAVEETITVAREAGVPSVASHLKAKGASYWGASHAATHLIREARAQGLQVYADQYTYDTSGTDGNTVLVPLWALAAPGREVGGQLGQLAEGSPAFQQLRANLQRRLNDPAEARRVRLDVEHEIARRGGASRIILHEFPEREYVGLTLEAIAARRGVSAVDAAIWLQLNGYNRPGGGRLRGHSMAEADIEHIMRQEFTATSTDGGTVELGDGIPHARFYGTYPRKIRRYVLERGTISLPFAIRSMTSLPAQIMGLRDRGRIHEGYWADLVIFDLDTIADRATFTDPHQYPDGIPYVFVNGVAVVDGGELTRATPGRVLTPGGDGRLRATD